MNETVISVRNLTKCFGNFRAVDGITFDVGRGEIFGFLGANGAGKTTAMRMLCGLSCPTSGSGTTGAAAKQLHRHYIGIEINAEYCALARARIGGTEK